MTHPSSVDLEESFMTFWNWDIDLFEGVVFPTWSDTMFIDVQ
jgi:hypothetical protein